MKKLVIIAALMLFLLWAYQVAGLTMAIRDQAWKEEARPSDIIVVLGAAEYKGKPLCTMVTADKDVSMSQVGVLMNQCLHAPHL